MRTTIDSHEDRRQPEVPRVESDRLARIEDAARAEELARAERRAGPNRLRRAWDTVKVLRRRERTPWSPARKGLAAAAIIFGLGAAASELIKHGHRELGEEFAVATILLLLLMILVVFARHFLAQELE